MKESMEQSYKEELEKYDNFYKELGEDLGYIDKDCVECGRHRVIKYSSGVEVCEKCNTDQLTKETYKNQYGYYGQYL